MEKQYKSQFIDIFSIQQQVINSSKQINFFNTVNQKNYIDQLADFITQDDDFMIITNYSGQKKQENFYSLLLDKNKLHLVKKNSQKTNEIFYYFKDQKIVLNKQEMPEAFIKEFNEKVERIAQDLNIGKAKAFDKA